MTAKKTSPEQLAQQLIAAKAAEAAANKARVAIEDQIVALYGAKPEGAETHELANGLKITITGKLTYKADMAALQEICGNLPEDLRPIKTEVKLDETGAKYLRANHQDVWRMLAPAITVSPAKTAVTIKA